ncbi:hypothetical protein M514_18505 [Trichuris suis]|uniref:Uncharacterized protein n=1 Tax=Trichuris suis TaxID=68888 RepID=A0A085NIR0_9BILA|nr:hypothetical protein M514_18505 [Trichuris suis]
MPDEPPRTSVSPFPKTACHQHDHIRMIRDGCRRFVYFMSLLRAKMKSMALALLNSPPPKQRDKISVPILPHQITNGHYCKLPTQSRGNL